MRALLLLRVWAARSMLRRALRWARHPLRGGCAVLLLAIVIAALSAVWFDSHVDMDRWWWRPVVLGVLTFGLLQATLNPWLFPRDLAFTPGEVALVFPAPVSRRKLLGARLLVAQPALLIAAALLSLLCPVQGHDLRARVIGGLYVVLSFLHANGVAASLANLPRSGSDRPGPLRGLVVAALLGALTVVLWSLKGVPLLALSDLTRLLDGDDSGLRAAAERLAAWAREGPQAWALAPFRALAELIAPPPLAPRGPTSAGMEEFFAAADELDRELRQLLHRPTDHVGLTPAPGSGFGWRLLDALPVVLAPFAFVLLGRAHILESALTATAVRQLRSEQLWQGTLGTFAEGALPPPPLPLGRTPGPMWALGWKNLAGITRVSVWRYAIDAVLLVILAIFVAGAEPLRPLREAALISAQACAGMAVLIAGDTSMLDMRGALKRPAWLRTLPIEGWRIVLGESLANTLMPWVVACLCLVLVAILSGGVPYQPAPSRALRWLAALGVMIALLPAIGSQVLVVNAACVFWPRLTRMPPTSVLDIVAMYALLCGRMTFLAVASAPALLAAVLWGVFGLAVLGPIALPIAGLVYALFLSAALVPIVILAGRRLDRWEPPASS